MKRVFFLVRSLNEDVGGGSHYNAIEQIRLFRQLGYKVDVHSLTIGCNKTPEDIKVTEHLLVKKDFISEILTIRKMLDDSESSNDIFFLYGVDFMWGGGLYRRMGGRNPVCVYLDTYLASMGLLEQHNYFYKVKRIVFDKTLGLFLAKSVDRYFAVSPWVQGAFTNFGFPEVSFRIFPNFFDFKNISIDFLHKTPTKINLLYTGRITYDKGVDLLIKALHKIDFDNWHLRIVGGGPEIEKCKDLVTKSGLENKVDFIPWLSQKDIQDEYDKADIFVHPARWPEPFGRTIVEALCKGVPVVVPELGGAAWIAKGASYEFKNGDLDSLVTAIKNIMQDYPSINVELSKKAMQRAAVFDVENIKLTVDSFFKELSR